MHFAAPELMLFTQLVMRTFEYNVDVEDNATVAFKATVESAQCDR